MTTRPVSRTTTTQSQARPAGNSVYDRALTSASSKRKSEQRTFVVARSRGSVQPCSRRAAFKINLNLIVDSCLLCTLIVSLWSLYEVPGCGVNHQLSVVRISKLTPVHTYMAVAQFWRTFFLLMARRSFPLLRGASPCASRCISSICFFMSLYLFQMPACLVGSAHGRLGARSPRM